MSLNLLVVYNHIIQNQLLMNIDVLSVNTSRHNSLLSVIWDPQCLLGFIMPLTWTLSSETNQRSFGLGTDLISFRFRKLFKWADKLSSAAEQQVSMPQLRPLG